MHAVEKCSRGARTQPGLLLVIGRQDGLQAVALARQQRRLALQPRGVPCRLAVCAPRAGRVRGCRLLCFLSRPQPLCNSMSHL
jgi:hypothetical protein